METKDLELFTVHRYRSKRLEGYKRMYSQDNLHVLVDDHVKDVLLAQGFDIQENPRSVFKVQKLYEALSHYAPGKSQKLVPGQNLSSGVALAYKCFARPSHVPPLHVLPMNPKTIATITSTPNASAGLTAYGCTKSEAQTRALERGIQTLKSVKKPEPCLAFKRTQFNDKTRLVWGYPYSMTVVEGLVAYSLNQRFLKGSTPMAFGKTTLHLGTELRVASYHKEWAYSLDYSQYDASISAELIHIAFKVLKTWYDLDEIEPVTGVTVREIFKVIEHYFIHTPIVMPDGKIYYGKDHGVPSGSYFTQMIDSVVNVIVAGAISQRFNLHVSKREVFVLGDDLMMWSNRKVDLDLIAKYVSENFGMKLHGKEKSEIFHYTDPVHYLGRDWYQGVPDLPVPEILTRMAFPETFRKRSKDPVKREFQVRSMILQYAWVYRSAWRIAERAFGTDTRNIARGCANLDVNTFLRGRGDLKLDPNAFSGLIRFKYRSGMMESEAQDIPNTAMQFMK